MTVRIVAEGDMAAAGAAFPAFGDVTLGPADVAAADALFVRAVTRLEESLLGASLRSRPACGQALLPG